MRKAEATISPTRILAGLIMGSTALMSATAPTAGAATSDPGIASTGSSITLNLRAQSGCTWRELYGREELQLWSGSDTSTTPVAAIRPTSGDSSTIVFDLGTLAAGTYSFGFYKGTEIDELGSAPCGSEMYYISAGQSAGVLVVEEPIADSDGDGLNDRDEEINRTDPKNPDTDGDGLRDGDEVKKYGTNPNNADTDGGGESDGSEVAKGTDPTKDGSDDDSDGDGLTNDFEVCSSKETIGVDCTGTSPTDSDTDDDGLNDGAETCARPVKTKSESATSESAAEDAIAAKSESATTSESAKKAESAKRSALTTESRALEVKAAPAEPVKEAVELPTCWNTNPLDPDTDDGGKSDGDEVKEGLDPLKKSDDLPVVVPVVDSDGDGLSDTDEVNKYRTDPKNPDTDGDGLRDGDEVTKHKTDPLNPDTDFGGMRDGDEVARGSDPLQGSDDDTDGDGLTDKRELEFGTDRLKPDTDGDGLTDGKEVNTVGSNPLKTDTDGDGAEDGLEVQRGTNPLVAGTTVTRSDSNSPGTPASLAFTGNESSVTLAALSLLGLGMVLLRARRRRTA